MAPFTVRSGRSILHAPSRIQFTSLLVLSLSLSFVSSILINNKVIVDKRRNFKSILHHERSQTQMMLLGPRPPSSIGGSGYPSRFLKSLKLQQEQSSLPLENPGEEEKEDEPLSNGVSQDESTSRRKVLRTASSLFIPPVLINIPPSHSIAVGVAMNPSESSSKLSAVDLDRDVDLKCLTDLPPVPSDMVRIYFCRHGQTENNRLRKVQGARVDPPLNDNGMRQATNLGQAIALSLSCQTGPGHSVPSKAPLIFSSTLQRAKTTASLVSKELSSNSTTESSRNLPRQLSDLGEIDFGPVADGQPISKVQQKMYQAYTRWSIGQIDYRPDGGGESGREVLQRASHAILQLVDEVVSSPDDVSSVIAVSHSGFLRVVLGILLDESLLKAAARKVWNGSVTIIDVPRGFTSSAAKLILGQRSKLLGGTFSQTPKDFQLIVPRKCTVRRVSEFRHLPPSTLIQQ